MTTSPGTCTTLQANFHDCDVVRTTAFPEAIHTRIVEHPFSVSAAGVGDTLDDLADDVIGWKVAVVMLRNPDVGMDWLRRQPPSRLSLKGGDPRRGELRRQARRVLSAPAARRAGILRAARANLEELIGFGLHAAELDELNDKLQEAVDAEAA